MTLPERIDNFSIKTVGPQDLQDRRRRLHADTAADLRRAEGMIDYITATGQGSEAAMPERLRWLARLVLGAIDVSNHVGIDVYRKARLQAQQVLSDLEPGGPIDTRIQESDRLFDRQLWDPAYETPIREAEEMIRRIEIDRAAG